MKASMRALSAAASSSGTLRKSQSKAQSRAIMLTAAPPAIVPTDNVVYGGSKPLSGRERERASAERRAISETISAAAKIALTPRPGALECPSWPSTRVR